MSAVVIACLLAVPAAPVPKKPPGPRPPTAAELAEAKRAYDAIGGRYAAGGGPDDRSHWFTLPPARSPDAYESVPDLPFDYRLTVPVRPDTPAGALRPLARLRHLRRVTIDGTLPEHAAPGEAAATGRVAELADAAGLEFLSVSGPLLTDELAGEIPRFAALRTLAGDGPVTDRGLERISRHPRLEAVSLPTDCPNVSAAGLAHLAGMPSLRRLGVQGCPGVTPAGLRPFADAPRLTSLAVGPGRPADVLPLVGRMVGLESVNLCMLARGEATTAADLRPVVRLPRLREIELPAMPHTDATVRELARATGVGGLRLFRCRAVTDDGVQALAGMPALESLSLSRADRVTDAGLAALADAPRLRTLDLDGAARVGDAGVRELTRSKTLTGLSLSGTGVTAAGVRAFAADRGDRLRHLGLAGTDATDHLIADVCRAAPRLWSLDLNQCKGVTDGSVDRLAGLTDLRVLVVFNTSITPPGVADLRRRLPGCDVRGPLPSP
jgi:hypothetical protein